MTAEKDVDILVHDKFFKDKSEPGVFVEVGAALPDYLSISARFRTLMGDMSPKSIISTIAIDVEGLELSVLRGPSLENYSQRRHPQKSVQKGRYAECMRRGAQRLLQHGPHQQNQSTLSHPFSISRP